MSRDDPGIERHLHWASRIRLETRSEHVRKDVKLYIDQRLDGEELIWLGSSLKADIAKSLNEKADGILHNAKAIRSAIVDLPESLYETYDNILLNVRKGDVEPVQRSLQWLAFSVMPLTLVELREVIAIEPGDGNINEESRLGSPQDILTIIGSLVNVTEQGHVRLAHLSIKEYLTSPRMQENKSLSKYSLDPLIGHRLLAIRCLTYLSFEDFLKGPEDILEAYLGRMQKYPLMKYAATAWPYHARATDRNETFDGIVSDFFSSNSRGKFLSWVQLLNADYAFEFDEYPKHATSLYYAASFRLNKIVASLVSQDLDLDAPGSRFGGTALRAAVLRQHIPVMKILLEAGADQNKSDFTDVTPLHTAATYGNVEVVKMLLKFGAKVDARDCTGQTPLDWAEKARQSEVLRLLRGTQSDIEEEGIQLSSPSSPPPSPLTIWKPSAPYSPNIYFKRSSTNSSLVSTLEIRGTQTPSST
ncbi:MAG: hypothetical protein M1820_007933 [Bogoriella megaspora]|nr:MAG: hypothetical protein M1820_007933 [Bogoriella megaspora]